MFKSPGSSQAAASFCCSRLCRIVFKIIPIEGEQLVNNAPQKRAHEMAAEALIALTLSRLKEDTDTGELGGTKVVDRDPAEEGDANKRMCRSLAWVLSASPPPGTL